MLKKIISRVAAVGYEYTKIAKIIGPEECITDKLLVKIFNDNLIAHVATINEDGMPCNVPVSFTPIWRVPEYDGQMPFQIAFQTNRNSRKALNIANNPLVSLSVGQDPDLMENITMLAHFGVVEDSDEEATLRFLHVVRKPSNADYQVFEDNRFHIGEVLALRVSKLVFGEIPTNRIYLPSLPENLADYEDLRETYFINHEEN